MKISRELLNKYNVRVPRYTSYPPATHFSDLYVASQFQDDLVTSTKQGSNNISLYLHFPFCPRVCLFCGCNTSVCINQQMIVDYINALKVDIRQMASRIDCSRPVTQIHWGGGTPNYLDPDLMQEVMDLLHSLFFISDNAEIAIECNPAYLDLASVDRYHNMGFNRFSLGVQDIHADVLFLVNRLPSAMPLEELVPHIQKNNDSRVNIDLMYGLPGQNLDIFNETIEQITSVRPDRLVTFSYAHVPWMKKHQEALEKHHLPGPEEKIGMLELAYNKITSGDYASIGMDHFALKQDELAKAFFNQSLYRNFQGYVTRERSGQVYAMGATGITQLWNAYGQNEKDSVKYVQLMNNGQWPLQRGYHLSDEQIIVREVITHVMCNKYISFEQLSMQLDVSKQDILDATGYDAERLKELVVDGLVAEKEDGFEILPDGFFFIRNVAMLFDPALRNDLNSYSKTV